ncbi:MAG TPA: HAMP domain-containing sensor histidine kinase [Vicinamibacterales bacterium]
MSSPRRRHFVRIIAVYVASLVVSIAMLVSWIVYVVQSASTINDMAQRVGGTGQTYHWIVLASGCTLMGLLIVGLTFQLAHAIGERNYSRRQEEFVSNITHEMKSPLTAIKLHAQTLEGGEVTTQDVQRSVGFILQQVSRMETLVDNVLESGRLMSRRKRTVLEPLELRPFFESYFDEIRTSVEGRGFALTVKVETRAVVMATAEALRRVMTNLVENAVRFSHKGGEIRCRVRDQSDRVMIEVEDDGVGIPRSELTKVFDRFYQIGRELSERRGGTGLGLSIVAGLVKEMNGRVWAQPLEGRSGTRFVVMLPFAGVES